MKWKPEPPSTQKMTKKKINKKKIALYMGRSVEEGINIYCICIKRIYFFICGGC